MIEVSDARERGCPALPQTCVYQHTPKKKKKKKKKKNDIFQNDQSEKKIVGEAGDVFCEHESEKKKSEK